VTSAATSAGQKSRASARSRQLDIFRGIAAVLMVTNHAGYHLLAPTQSDAGWPGALVFAGSAAPALFFFATGVGSGMAPDRPEAFQGVVRKVLLLLLADSFMNWGYGVLLGLDFFGFAAISMATLFLVRRTSRPALVAAGLLALVCVARFGLVSVLHGAAEDNAAVAFVTGIGGSPHISYPLCPWLAFPLAGFLIGRSAAGVSPLREQLAGLAIALAGFGGAIEMARHGAVVHRWGTVSLAYFLFAIAFVTALWLVASWLERARSAAVDGLLLRGPASLLIVPLHYGALGLIAATLGTGWPPGAWLAGTVLLCVAVLVTARAMVALLGSTVTTRSAGAQCLALALAAAATLAAFQWAPKLLLLEVACLAEIVVAAVLFLSSRASRPAGLVPAT
jgi:uncharacterized membrane protein